MRSIAPFLTDLLWIFFGVWGLLRLLLTGLGLACSGWVIPLFLFCLLFSLTQYLRRGRWPMLLALILSGVAAVFRLRYCILDGLKLFSAAYLQAADHQFGLSIPYSPVLSGAYTQELCCLSVVLALGFISAMFLSWAVFHSRGCLLAAMFPLPLFMLVIAVEPQPDLLALLLLALFWTGVLIPSAVRSESRLMSARLSLILLPAACILFTAIALLWPKDSYERAEWPDRVFSAVYDRVTGSTPSLQPVETPEKPEIAPLFTWMTETEHVNLADAGPRRYTWNTVLQVESSVSGIVYLRGSAMNQYTGSSWEATDAYISAVFAETGERIEPLFMASQTMDSLLESVLITTVSDQSGLVYLPYYAEAPIGLTVDINEHCVRSRRSLLGSSYTILFHEDEPDIPAVNSPEQLELQESYRKHVYSTYLRLPEPVKEELLVLAGEQGFSPDMDRVMLVDQVADYIKSAARYDLSAPKTPDDEDFVLYFLKESKRGYCVHFASAAAAMLQALGVPARYVTGFMVEIPGNRLNTQINVPDNCAHAWIEVYFDGVGWIPYEVTGSNVGSSAPTDPEESSPMQPVSTPLIDVEGTDIEDKKSPTPLAWLPLTALLMIPLGLIVRRAVILSRRERRFYDPNRNQAAIEIWLYIEQLCKWADTPPQELYQLALKAKYSQHHITPEELARLRAYADQTALQIDNQIPWYKQAVFRFWYCLV